MTNEQIQAILDGAPNDWTHYCTRNRHYFKRDGNTDRIFVWLGGTKVWSVPLMDAVRWLERRERLEEILTLRQEVERLKAQQFEVALNAYAVAYKEGFGDGLETDKHIIDEINRTASSINLYEYNLHNIAKCKAYKYANQLREQGDE